MRVVRNLTLLVILSVSTSFTSADYKAGQDKSQVCAGCHGVDGNSQINMYPRLAGQHKDYLEYALKGYRSGDRKNAIMSGFAKGLTDKDIEDLSIYYSKQEGLNTLPKK
jgi:cytochrome c553